MAKEKVRWKKSRNPISFPKKTLVELRETYLNNFVSIMDKAVQLIHTHTGLSTEVALEILWRMYIQQIATAVEWEELEGSRPFPREEIEASLLSVRVLKESRNYI